MPSLPADEDALTRAIIALASEYGRYGYRRVAAGRRLADRQGSGSAHRASRGAEGPPEAQTAQPSGAERRLMRAAAPALSQPRLELRLRAGTGP
jgi:hypothetical protein